MSEVSILGDGLRLTLTVNGYERARRGEHYDDNWLRGSVSLEIAAASATFSALCDIAWQTTDLSRFEQALTTLLGDLTGVANLSTLEDQVELTIRLTAGRGSIEGRLQARDAIASVAFTAPTDQSLMGQTLLDLRQINETYPVRR